MKKGHRHSGGTLLTITELLFQEYSTREGEVQDILLVTWWRATGKKSTVLCKNRHLATMQCFGILKNIIFQGGMKSAPWYIDCILMTMVDCHAQFTANTAPHSKPGHVHMPSNPLLLTAISSFVITDKRNKHALQHVGLFTSFVIALQIFHQAVFFFFNRIHSTFHSSYRVWPHKKSSKVDIIPLSRVTGSSLKSETVC